LESRLQRLNAKILDLSAKGNELGTIQMREESVRLHRDLFGMNSDEASTCTSSLLLALNSAAMKALAMGSFEVCHRLLVKAATLTHPDSSFVKKNDRLKLRALTLNNLGCYFKRAGKPRIALKYLLKASDLEAMIQTSAESRVKTFLNIASIKSDNGDHDGARKTITGCIDIIQQETRKRLEEPSKTDGLSAFSNCGYPKSNDRETKIESLMQLYVISYYNLGVVLECMGNFRHARQAFRLALSRSSSLGQNHPLVNILKDIEEAIQRPDTKWLCRETVWGRDT
ncbi:unnamed protein product, partial [Heterosigma akashiwo]